MFDNKTSKNKHPIKQQSITLNKMRSSYDKLEKEMNKPPTEYEAIKALVEEHENSIGKIRNRMNKNKKPMY